MMRKWSLAIVFGLFLASAATAQSASWQFHWQVGQVLSYRVEQITSAAEVVEGKKTETTSKVTNVKRWQALQVDAAGVATLQLSLTALRVETTTPAGEVMLFDSANPQGSNARMREQLTRYVGSPLAVLRVNGQGKVIEVKECKFGPPSRFESEPPFVLTLPEGEPKANWERTYNITLDPPHGTGEKYAAVQKYVCQAKKDATITVGVTTVLQAKPEAVADQVPLLQMQPEGAVVFNLPTGVMESARLSINKELKGHQGEGSSYQFRSSYVEQLLPRE
jgi:hypothetical protein